MDGAFATIKDRLDAIDLWRENRLPRPDVTEDMIDAFAREWYGDTPNGKPNLTKDGRAIVRSALNAVLDTAYDQKENG